MFQSLRHCFTTGGMCPHREEVVPECVTEGFCGGKRGPRTGITPLHWQPLSYLKDGVDSAIKKSAESAPGAVGHKLTPYPPLYTTR
mmetsp:Transcript_26864/g.62209  ORF Transcript_26864/g.62209 Transcript_26864/m.62209 type:complete len:86 (+) Transcript_26864:82-339(+)